MNNPFDIAIIGGGPAGLMAAEASSAQGFRVAVFDAMPSLGRKFLMAGKSGLNLTHSEPLDQFIQRYGPQKNWVEPYIRAYPPTAICDWAQALGIETFTGSSGRIFPRCLKGSPLLRSWIRRLVDQGVSFHLKHRWQGWGPQGELVFSTPDGIKTLAPKATILSMGGSTWPRLGSDGAWMEVLREQRLPIQAPKPTNCGFECDWSKTLLEKHAGAPLKNIRLLTAGREGHRIDQMGEALISRYGLEGSLIYSHSILLRDLIDQEGYCDITLDLLPDLKQAFIDQKLLQPMRGLTTTRFLERQLKLPSVKIALLRERLSNEALREPQVLATALKSFPIRLNRTRPLEEAISSGGGLGIEALNDNLMVRTVPGLFCCGEMLDFEAPTGGYLLTACLATGKAAGMATAQWLRQNAGSLAGAD